MSEIVRIPKKLRDICGLYRKCQFEEADIKLEKFNILPHQKAAIKSQLAFFQWDFEKTIELCFEYIPYLDEWYTGNMWGQSIAMFVFAGVHSNKIEVSNFLKQLLVEHSKINELEENHFSNFILSNTNEWLDILNGNIEKYIKSRYIPPVTPISLLDIVENYTQGYYKKYSKLDDAESVNHILGPVYENGDLEDFLNLYEKYTDSPEISEINRIDVVRAYIYKNEHEKAKQAILDLVRFSWNPIESTDIMPVSLLTGCGHGWYDLWALFSEELFKEIYSLSKE